MAEHKKKRTPPARDGHAFAVVLESLQADFRVFGGALASLRQDTSGLREEVNDLRGEVGELRGDVSGLRGEVGGLRGEVNDLRGDVNGLREELRGDMKRVDGRLDRLETDMALVKVAILDTRREVKELGKALERKVDRLELVEAGVLVK